MHVKVAAMYSHRWKQVVLLAPGKATVAVKLFVCSGGKNLSGGHEYQSDSVSLTLADLAKEDNLYEGSWLLLMLIIVVLWTLILVT